VTVIPLSWALLKIAAPSIEKEFRDRPVSMKKMIKMPGFVLGKRPIFARIAMTIHPGE
jgi:hypothetical protein